MFERLEAIKVRYEQLTEELSKPEVLGDYNQLKKLSKEQKDLEETYVKYKEYQKVINNLANKKSVRNFDFEVMSVGSEFKKVAFSSFSVNDFKSFNYSVSLEHATQLKGTKYHLIIFKIN